MIPTLPPDLRIIDNENNVFRNRRADVDLGDRIGHYSNAAQVVLGYFQSITPDSLEHLYSSEIASPLIAAGRILDTASAELFRTAKEKAQPEIIEGAIATGLIAAQAHAFYGNFPAAETIGKRFVGHEKYLSAFQLCALCCAAPSLVGQVSPFLQNIKDAKDFIEALEAFLNSGEAAREDVARGLFLRLRGLLETAFDHAVWMSCEICFQQLINLSLAKMLPEVLGPSSATYIPLLAKAGIKALLPPQFLAFRRPQLIQGVNNAIISLPTSTGKTLLSELCIISSVSAPGRIGVFVVPYVALGRQIASRVSSILPDDWKVVKLFGGFKQSGISESAEFKYFIVATPERLDAFLRFSSASFSKIDCVVFDEAHLIEGGQRGARIEGLIARLLMSQRKGDCGRLLVVSAVVPNTERLATWIGATEDSQIKNMWSPSCRRLAVWHADGRLAWYHSGDPVTPPGATSDEAIAAIKLPWPNKIFLNRYDFGEQRYYREANDENLVYLCHYMWDRYREPILCVCSTRESSRKTAAKLGARFEPLETITGEIQKAIDLIVTQYAYYTHLLGALKRGVAYHNASLPHDLRATIEDAARCKELRCVVSTTTLAEGVDLPFRVTVIADWLRYKGDKQVPYSPLLIRNISGRCGRVGYFTEGDIVIYDNPLGEPQFKAIGRKEDWQKRVFFSRDDQGIESVLQTDFGDSTIRAAFASQYLAAIAENPGTDHIESEFTKSLFIEAQNTGAHVSPFISAVTEDLLSGDMPFASRNSPIQLNEIGRSVNQTGFCPSSCRKILVELQTVVATDDIELAFTLLGLLGDLPEQGDGKFSKLVQREKYNREPDREKKQRPPKTLVRIENLPVLLSHWLEGMQPIDIFATLPLVQKSKRVPAFAEWREGLDQVSDWDAEFDKFCDFLRSTVFEFLPWLLRACSLLDPYVKPDRGVDWMRIAERYQRDSTATKKEEE